MSEFHEISIVLHRDKIGERNLMLRSIHSIVHPFMGYRTEGLIPYYKELVRRVRTDSTAHLVFTSVYDHSVAPSFHVKGDFRQIVDERSLERDLLIDICDVYKNNKENVSLLVSDDPYSPFEQVTPLISTRDHPYFAEMTFNNGPETFVSEDYAKVFHRWRGETCAPFEYQSDFIIDHVQIAGQNFITFPIPNEAGKILKRLPLDQIELDVNGASRKLFKNYFATNGIGLIGHGKYLESCVITQTASIALTLGFYLRYIMIDDEQNKYESPDQQKENQLPSNLKFPFGENYEKNKGFLLFGFGM